MLCMSYNEEFIWVDYQKNTSADFQIRNQALIIQMKEDLDHHNAIFIREQADRLLEMKNIHCIIFDFTKVSFMDSSGIGVIMGRYKKLKLLGGGKLFVIGVSDRIDRILRLSGLYKIVARYSNVGEDLNQI